MTKPEPDALIPETAPLLMPVSLPAPGRLEAVAARAGFTEGQLYTAVISSATALALVIAGGVPLGKLPTVASALPRPPAAAPPVVIAPEPPTPGLPSTPALPAIPFPDVPGSTPAGPQDTTPSDQPPSQPAPLVVAAYQIPPPGAPAAIFASSSELYVGTDNTGTSASRLFAFGLRDAAARTFTITGQPQQRTGGLSAATASGNALLVTDRSRAALLSVDRSTGQQRVLTLLPDLPPCLVGVAGICQPGAQDLAPSPEGVAILGKYAYITDAAQGTIWRYGLASRQITAWYSSGDFASGSGPSGLAVDPSGNLIFTVASSTDVSALLMGAVYRLPIASDGSPGPRSLLATFPGGSTPGPVVAGASGDIYVGLRGAGAVAVVHPDGTSANLVGPGIPTFKAPHGLFLANGVLYVADQGDASSASSGTVKLAPVFDGPPR